MTFMTDFINLLQYLNNNDITNGDIEPCMIYYDNKS